jgi:glycosyltransferase involved in cell wall biosynthesis
MGRHAVRAGGSYARVDEFERARVSSIRPLRIAQVAPPLERVPPIGYGGTERVVYELTAELVRRGHDVTVFASGDSEVPCRLVPTVDKALRPAGFGDDPSPYFLATIGPVIDQAVSYDVVHSHLEWWSLALTGVLPVPVASTFHGRLDVPWSRQLLASRPPGLVAISRSQASVHPDMSWTIIHNGLSLAEMPTASKPSDALCFVGRVEAAKGILEAMEIAALTGRPLRIAAKIGTTPEQRSYYDDVFKPALERAGSDVEYFGELDVEDRNRLYADSYASLMPGAWPEPFGLVAIEALACGTPVLARRVGALPEIIRDGIDGFFGDDPMHLAFLSDQIAGLDRRAIRNRVIDRFSAARMTDRYEDLYLRLIDGNAALGRSALDRWARGPGTPESADAGESAVPDDARRPLIPVGPDRSEIDG